MKLLGLALGASWVLHSLNAYSISNHHRDLQTTEFFAPLNCNDGELDECVNFSDWYDPSIRTYENMFTIDCGICVVMDDRIPSGVTFDFLGGLDIQGKLVFPEPSDSSYRLRIRTPTIIVQGELEMSATKEVDGEPNYIFRMTGDQDYSFQPADNNAAIGLTDVGKRAITVAGGKVTRKYTCQMGPEFFFASPTLLSQRDTYRYTYFLQIARHGRRNQ